MKKLIIILAMATMKTVGQGQLYYKIVANSFQDNQSIMKLSPQWIDFETVGAWTAADSTSSSGKMGTFRMYSVGYANAIMIRSVTHHDFLYNIGVKNENTFYPNSKRLHYTLMPTTFTGKVKLEDGYIDRFAFLNNQTYTGAISIMTITSNTLTSTINETKKDSISEIKDSVIFSEDSLISEEAVTEILQEKESHYNVEYLDLKGIKSDKKGVYIEIKYYIGRIEKRKILILE